MSGHHGKRDYFITTDTHATYEVVQCYLKATLCICIVKCKTITKNALSYLTIAFKERENGIIKCSVKTTKEKFESMNREEKQYEAKQNR